MHKDEPYKLDQVAIRMVRERPLYSDKPIHSPADAVRELARVLRDYDREVLCVVNLQTDNRPINLNMVSMGTLNASIVTPREVLKSAVLSNASSILILHNHPSGRIIPSPEDCRITDHLSRACALMDIPLLDHIIVGNDQKYYSMASNQEIPLHELDYTSEPEKIQFNRQGQSLQVLCPSPNDPPSLKAQLRNFQKLKHDENGIQKEGTSHARKQEKKTERTAR